MSYKRDRARVDKVLRKAGVVVVMNKDHIKTPEHMATTMTEVYKAGLAAEITFRIDEALLREGMKELVKVREECPEDNPFILAIGSVINPMELEAAIEMGFDMIVAPANVMGGYGEGKDFVKRAHAENIFAAPAVFTPTEFNYFLERDDNLVPDAFKIFPARSHGPKGIGDLLAPYARARHNGRIVMPTGAVDFVTGPQHQEFISKFGFFPVLGMSAPLALVKERKKPGDVDTIRESLESFKAQFKPFEGNR